jgi:predicted aconitase with swiveling domain
MKVVLKGRRISKGKGEGDALVTSQSISFLAGVNPDNGIIVDKEHELRGMCITDKVLVFPGGKGSTGGSWIIMRMVDNKTAPAAMINIETEPIVAVGSILAKIPLVDKLDKNPMKIIRNGDFVRVKADEGMVEIIKKKSIVSE